MDYTQTFEDFAKGLGPMDLALYAGVGIILWVLFKDKLSPVQQLLSNLFNNFRKTETSAPETKTDGNILDGILVPKLSPATQKRDLFFDLIASWKQTRDLAVKNGCDKAVSVIDDAFPFLSPTGCLEEVSTNE